MNKANKLLVLENITNMYFVLVHKDNANVLSLTSTKHLSNILSTVLSTGKCDFSEKKL